MNFQNSVRPHAGSAVNGESGMMVLFCASLVLVICTTLILSLGNRLFITQKEGARAPVVLGMISVRNSIRVMVNNDTAWSKTIKDSSNSYLNCLNSATAPCTAGQFNLKVLDPFGQTFVDGTTNQFSADGSWNCTANCAYQAIVTATVTCSSGATTCLAGQASVSVNINVSGLTSDAGIINANNYAINVVKL